MEGFIYFISITYAIVGAISIIGFWPQIKALLVSKTRSFSVSIKTWALWTFEAFIGLLYGMFILQDLLFLAIIAFDVLGSAVILGLTIYNRYFRFNNKTQPVIRYQREYYILKKDNINVAISASLQKIPLKQKD